MTITQYTLPTGHTYILMDNESKRVIPTIMRKDWHDARRMDLARFGLEAIR